MTKVEFYNSVVKVYNETGQGVPGFLRMKMNPRIIDSLIEEGYLKSVTIPFNHLPDDESICLTKGYCVEEDMLDRSTLPLSYVRLYKGLEQGLQTLTGMTNEKLVTNPEFMTGYAEWLNKNHSKLTEKIELLDENMKFQPLTTEEMEYLQSRDWFKQNKSVGDCIDNMYEKTSNLRESLGLYKQLLKLYESSTTHSNKIEKTLEERNDVEKELKMRETIHDFLSECKNKKTKIQEYIIMD